MAFSETQKRIALILLHSSKTAEELNKQLDIPYDKLTKELKAMLKVGVIEKKGFPTKYILKENIAERAKRRKTLAEKEPDKLRLKIIVEAQAIEQDLMEKSLKQIEEQIRAEKEFTIYDLVLQKTIKEGEHYKSFLEIDLTVKNFKAMVRMMFFYAPTTVEVLRPSKLEFSAADLQEGLVDAAQMVQGYTSYIMKLMDRQQLAAFNRKI